MIDLKNVLEQHPEVIDNRSRLQGLLWDLYPEERRNIHILMTLYEEGIIVEIRRKLPNISTRFSCRLESDYGILPTLSLPMITLWQEALEKQNLLKRTVIPSSSQEILSTDEVKIGSVLKFGSYWQGEYESDGKTPIEWLVLDTKEDCVLLISKYCLDIQPYNKKRINVAWENSTLRRWLNNDFYNKAFNNEEKTRIRLTNITTKGYEKWKMSPVNNTQDKVFLLSVDEVRSYFKSDKDRLCDPTKHVSGSKEWGKSRWWWLRSPGVNEGNASSVSANGFLSYYGFYVNYTIGAVRPSIWLNTDGSKKSATNVGGSKITISVPAVPAVKNTQSGQSVAVGDILKFGSYGQGNSQSKVPLEWRVLAIEEGKALVISRFCLDKRAYNLKPEAVAWENSTIRQWLNGDFYNHVFSQEEKKRISPTMVKADKAWPGLTTYDTQDKLFLLSKKEAMLYFKDDMDRQCGKTLNKNNNLNENEQWWLRSPGVGAIRTACIDRSGRISSYGVFMDDTNITVRPVFWLMLTAKG